MDTAVIITLIIVGGIVIISLMAIGWLWSMTSRGIGPGASVNRQKELEEKVKDLQREVVDIKKRLP